MKCYLANSRYIQLYVVSEVHHLEGQPEDTVDQVKHSHRHDEVLRSGRREPEAVDQQDQHISGQPYQHQDGEQDKRGKFVHGFIFLLCQQQLPHLLPRLVGVPPVKNTRLYHVDSMWLLPGVYSSGVKKDAIISRLFITVVSENRIYGLTLL